MTTNAPAHFQYSRWRHGGWYVDNVRYPSGACGCVSRNYQDRKWRIACDPRPFEQQPTFKNRDAAALAEWHLARERQEHFDAIMARIDAGEIDAGEAIAMLVSGGEFDLTAKALVNHHMKKAA